MGRILGKFAPYLYAVLRIIAGLMFALHGSQKLLGFPSGGPPAPLPPLILFGGAIELVAGLMIALGLLGRYAAFVASGEMAAAYFMAHFPHGVAPIQNYLPIVNRGELAVLYCFLFLYIAAAGSGVWSIDALAAGPIAERPRSG